MFSFVLRLAVPPALLVSVVLTAAGPAASAVPRTAPRSIAVHGPADHGLNSVATSCGHGCVQVTAAGFKATEKVRIRQLLRPGWQRVVRADRSGQVCFRWTGDPRRADVVTFVGLGSNAAAASAGDVSVSVPRIAVYRINASR